MDLYRFLYLRVTKGQYFRRVNFPLFTMNLF